MGGGVGVTVMGNGVVVGWGEGVWGIYKMYCWMPDLNLTERFKYSTLLCFQLREILGIKRPTISFNENHQPFQGCNPTTTIEITIIKKILDDLQKYSEKNNK